MSVRNKLLKSLQEELLGPRDGIEEIIKNPDFEYVTGLTKIEPVVIIARLKKLRDIGDTKCAETDIDPIP